MENISKEAVEEYLRYYLITGLYRLRTPWRSQNEWSYTSTPQYAFMAWCSVKAQGQLYFTFYLSERSVTGQCYKWVPSKYRNRSSLGGIETRLQAGWLGFNSRSWKLQDFSFRHRVQTGYGGHPSPTIAKITKAWRYTSTPPIRLHSVVLN
jgi:hypothetical protein